ncbi:acetyltransferase [Thiothrix lacustris]|uniref:acetyltransferase n=1 Tax=Thiothrix lacustris TaxID=525917 RepID=UPI0027E59669|nr:acetyltransferase [Thiothrix lacustris]WMP17963.1 acetyltransferase [Thiothrix lacustris]
MIYIYGAGGHGKVVFHTFTSMGKTIAAFLDDKANRFLCGLPVIIPSEVQASPASHIHFAIGNNRIRHDLQTSWQQLGMIPASAIHPLSILYPSATIGHGCLLTAGSVIGPDAVIGSGCIINHNAVVEHDTHIGDFCHIAQSAIISGGVNLGTQCFVSAGSVILPYLTIGKHVTIAAGVTVPHNLPDYSTFPPLM